MNKETKSENIILKRNDVSKVDCFDITVKIPDAVEPGSKLEKRYLDFLVRKYSDKQDQLCSK